MFIFLPVFKHYPSFTIFVFANGLCLKNRCSNMETKADDNIDGYVFQWKLENVSHCWRLKRKFGIASLDFIADALENTRWCLHFAFKDENDDDDYIGIYLYREGDCSGPDVIEIKYQLALLGNDGTILTQKTSSKRSFTKACNWGFKSFESREKVFVTQREVFLPEDTLTVQGMIWKKEEAPVHPKRIYARTIFKMNKGSFLWKVDNFSTPKPSLIKKIKHSSIDFDLVLNKDQDFEKHLDININLLDEGVKCLSLKTSIVDSKGKKENSGIHEYFIHDLRKEVLSMPLFSDKLMENKGGHFPTNVLHLDCEYSILTRTILYEYLGFEVIFPQLTSEDVEKRKDHQVQKEKSQNASDLVNDLKSMYSSAILCDTELRTSTRTFPAHKNILSARSPVFRRMFSSDMKEKNSGHVDIADVEDDTLDRLLLFVYTDSLVDLHLENAAKLYVVADKYEILTLKSRCSSFLKENLNPTNVCDVLDLSHLHQDDELKSSVQDYILKHDKEVFGTQEWKDFIDINPKLAADTMYRRVFPG